MQELAQQLEDDRIPDAETIGRLRGAIVNLETLRKSTAKARSEKDEAVKAFLQAEKAVSESPFTGQTVGEARQEASAPPKVSFNAVPSLAVFFLMLAAAAGITVFTVSRYGALLTGWEKALPWGIFAIVTAAAAFVSHRMRQSAVKAAENAALEKRFGTADPAAISALADAYGKLLEERDTAQGAVSARTATAEALSTSLTTNEQAILLEVRRFAPAAFDIPAADQALRAAGQRRRVLSDAEDQDSRRRHAPGLARLRQRIYALFGALRPPRGRPRRGGDGAHVLHLRHDGELQNGGA